MQAAITFGCWPIRGIAQPIRYLLEYVKLPYEEKRYVRPEEWFEGDSLKAPFNSHTLANIPYIRDGEECIYESSALTVYLAHRSGRPELLGRTPEEQLKQAQLQGVIQDIVSGFRKVISMPQDQYAQFAEQAFQSECQWLLQRLDQEIKGSQFATGNNLCTVDFELFELEETIYAYRQDHLEQYPILRSHHEKIMNLPEIQVYMQSERFIKKPFYPPGVARWC